MNTSLTSRPAVLRSAVAVLAAAGAFGLTACGSGSGGSGGLGLPDAPSTSAVANTSPRSATTSAVPSTPAPAPTSEVSTSSDASQPSGVAAASLLTQSEVGYGFTRTESNDMDGPLPCTPGEPGPLAQSPSDDHAQIDFTSPRQDAQITERVIRYADAAGAQQVISAVRAGFGCDTADAGGAKVYIVGPNDIRSAITANVESADDWDLRSGEFQSEMIVVQAGNTVVQMAFTRVSGAQSTDLDPSRLLEAAIAKAVNGG